MVCTKEEKELLVVFDQKLLEIQREMTAEYMRIKELFKTYLDHDNCLQGLFLYERLRGGNSLC